MVVITEFEEHIATIIAVIGTILVPVLIFFSRLWQRVGTLEQQMRTSIEVRKDLQEHILPIFQQARIDIEVTKERLEQIYNDVQTIKKDHERARLD